MVLESVVQLEDGTDRHNAVYQRLGRGSIYSIQLKNVRHRSSSLSLHASMFKRFSPVTSTANRPKQAPFASLIPPTLGLAER